MLRFHAHPLLIPRLSLLFFDSATPQVTVSISSTPVEIRSPSTTTSPPIVPSTVQVTDLTKATSNPVSPLADSEQTHAKTMTPSGLATNPSSSTKLTSTTSPSPLQSKVNPASAETQVVSEPVTEPRKDESGPKVISPVVGNSWADLVKGSRKLKKKEKVYSLEKPSSCSFVRSSLEFAMERFAMGNRLWDSESSDADSVEVRLFVNDSSIGDKDTLNRDNALIKHFSSFGKVSDIHSTGPRYSVLHLRGEAAVVESKEKLNDGGCECDVEGGCKIVVDDVFPDDEPIIMAGRGHYLPDYSIDRSRKLIEKLERKKAKKNSKKKAKKPEPLKSYDNPKLNGGVSILVSGYNTSLPEYEIKTLIYDHFSSCGEITGVNFANRLGYKGIVVNIKGDKAEENASLLNQSVVGGRKLVVKVVPPEAFDRVSKLSPAIIRRINEQNERLRQRPPPPDLAVVTGFDTQLPLDEIKTALSKHFSSCGEITCISILEARNGGLDRLASLYFREKGAAYKAFQLSGTDVGGWKANVVKHISPMHQTY